MNLDLSFLDTATAPPVVDGKPLDLPLDLIDEDPNQPRELFDAEYLTELSSDIAERGVRTPISVRTHPTVSGRYMLNFGAHRTRASRMAGKATIPAYLDETADDFDQVAENELRRGLQPLELALFVRKKINAGMSQKDIAHRLRKTKGFISQIATLTAPTTPSWVLDLARQGRCRGLLELYDLAKLAEQHGSTVERWCAERTEPIVRSDVTGLKQLLAAPPASPAPAQAPAAPVEPVASVSADSGLSEPVQATSPQPNPAAARVSAQPVEQPADEGAADVPSSPAQATAGAAGRIVVVGQLKGREVEVLLQVLDEEGVIAVRSLPSGKARLVPAADVKLLRVAKV